MKKFLLPFALTLTFSVTLHSAYVVKALSLPETSRNFFPRINSKGHVVWSGTINNYQQIFYYNGKHTKQITNNFSNNRDPWINSKGQMTWSSDLGVVFCDDGFVRYLGPGQNPMINNKGMIVYQNENKVYLWSNGASKELGTGTSPQINNKGHVLWNKSIAGAIPEIYFYDGVQAKLIAMGKDAKFNNKDEIVWTRPDPNGLDIEVFLYSGGAIKQVTHNEVQENSPEINNKGQMLWKTGCTISEPCESFSAIAFFDGRTVLMIDRPSRIARPISLNNKGQFVWASGQIDFDFSDVFVYDSGSVIQLSNNDTGDGNPQINNKGQIVWASGGLSAPIVYLASPEKKANTAFSSYNDESSDHEDE